MVILFVSRYCVQARQRPVGRLNEVNTAKLEIIIYHHLSPPGSTSSRYVCSGSEDGSVYSYNTDVTIAGNIDIEDATQNSRPRDPDLYASSAAAPGIYD